MDNVADDAPHLPRGKPAFDHLGCYLVKRAVTEVTLYGPRSSAESLLHALKVAAISVV